MKIKSFFGGKFFLKGLFYGPEKGLTRKEKNIGFLRMDGVPLPPYKFLRYSYEPQTSRNSLEPLEKILRRLTRNFWKKNKGKEKLFSSFYIHTHTIRVLRRDERRHYTHIHHTEMMWSMRARYTYRVWEKHILEDVWKEKGFMAIQKKWSNTQF